MGCYVCQNHIYGDIYINHSYQLTFIKYTVVFWPWCQGVGKVDSLQFWFGASPSLPMAFRSKMPVLVAFKTSMSVFASLILVGLNYSDFISSQSTPVGLGTFAFPLHGAVCHDDEVSHSSCAIYHG